MGGVCKKPIYGGKLPKKERAWTVYRFKGGLDKNEGGGVFEGG